MSVEWSGEGGSPLHSHDAGTFGSPFIKTGRGIGTETCSRVELGFEWEKIAKVLKHAYSYP